MRSENLKFRNDFRTQAKASVKTGSIIVAFRKIISRCEKSQIMLPANVAFNTNDADVGIFINKTLDATNNARIGESSLLAIR